MLTSSFPRGRFSPRTCKPLALAIHLSVASAAGVLNTSIAHAQTAAST